MTIINGKISLNMKLNNMLIILSCVLMAGGILGYNAKNFAKPEPEIQTLFCKFEKGLLGFSCDYPWGGVNPLFLDP